MRIRVSVFSTIVILLTGTVFLCCKNKQKEPDEPMILVGEQSVSALIDTQLNKSFEDGERVYTSGNPFIYFYATHSIDTVRTAIAIYNINDSTAIVKWYRLENGQWKLRDSINGLPGGKEPVSAVVDDYNFDGQADIYLQETVAAPNSLVYGRLFTIDPATKQLTEQPDVREMGNLSIDKPTRSLVSNYLKALGKDLEPAMCDVISKWEKGKLKTISRLCESD